MNVLHALGYLFRDVSVADVLKEYLSWESNGLEGKTKLKFLSTQKIESGFFSIRLGEHDRLSN